MAFYDKRKADVNIHTVLDKHMDNSLFVLLIFNGKLLKTDILLAAFVIFIHFSFNLLQIPVALFGAARH